MSIYRKKKKKIKINGLARKLETLVMSESGVHPFSIITEDNCLLGNVVVANVGTYFTLVADLTLPVTLIFKPWPGLWLSFALEVHGFVESFLVLLLLSRFTFLVLLALFLVFLILIVLLLIFLVLLFLIAIVLFVFFLFVFFIFIFLFLVFLIIFLVFFSLLFVFLFILLVILFVYLLSYLVVFLVFLFFLLVIFLVFLGLLIIFLLCLFLHCISLTLSLTFSLIGSPM